MSLFFYNQIKTYFSVSLPFSLQLTPSRSPVALKMAALFFFCKTYIIKIKGWRDNMSFLSHVILGPSSEWHGENELERMGKDCAVWVARPSSCFPSHPPPAPGTSQNFSSWKFWQPGFCWMFFKWHYLGSPIRLPLSSKEDSHYWFFLPWNFYFRPK